MSAISNVIKSLKINYPLLIILVIGVSIAFSAAISIRKQENAIALHTFNKQATDAARSVQKLFTASIDATAHFAAFNSQTDDISQKTFLLYAWRIKYAHPAIQALEWVPRVTEKDLIGFEKDNRQHFGHYSVLEKNPTGGLVPATKRPVYFPVKYIYPVKENMRAIGYDIASDKARKRMLNKALKNNELTASSRVTLVQEQSDSYSVLVAMPVFKKNDLPALTLDKNNNLKGFIIGAYRINDIIELSLLKGSYIPSEFTFSEVSKAQVKSPLYKINQADAIKNNWFSYNEDLEIAGCIYTIEIKENPGVFFNKIRMSTLTLLTGIVLSFLSIIYIALIQKRNLQLSQANTDLKQAMDEIKTLKGIIPICSYCHGIRDDEGAWKQLEQYISKHSDASFSHGICPSCLPKARNNAGLKPK